ncbi:hypothetical protein AVEN_175979-1 [Araneus ventricosus]|uniref:Uncharacterized protein n=1 Tax=Araneus ventricosus TaxID=182803 RepID=A0A4Y2KG25_ARAVE|nr:hypothetical protein AVEN_175979-1 [Araneus ventricosus]
MPWIYWCLHNYHDATRKVLTRKIHQFNKIIFQLAPSLGSHKIVISDTKLMKWLSLKVVSILYYFHQIK